MYEAFIDLDELILRCRDKLSRKFIQEAVSCYRVGAFRSCIVSTWNAVVFDFLHKLRELELLGDGQAAKLLEKFENLRSSGKQFKELWQFESDIPEMALTKFELISNIEKSDIERLFDDRSRCAHPSMTSLEEPFEATAELARYHLRSAVTHLLARPPVQGRAACERIFTDIASEYFPIDPELAIKHFQKSPLARARFVLIKEIVIGLTKSLLLDDRLDDERARQLSALNAVSTMYHQETTEILDTQLSEIIISRVTDENWDKVIIYLGSTNGWDNLSEPCQLKAAAYINKIEIYETSQHYKRLSQNALLTLVKASHINFLRDSIVKILQIPLKDLLSIKEVCKDIFFKENILIPVLRESSSQADLDELLMMRAEPLLRLDENVQSNLRQKATDSDLPKLVSILSNCQDEWLLDLIKSEIEIKIPTTSLKVLLSSKSKYRSIFETKDFIVELFDDSIAKQLEEEMKAISLEAIVSLMIRSEDEFFIDLVKSNLEDKISTAQLEDLLKTKSIYKECLDEPEIRILNLLDTSINHQLKIISFNDLINLRNHWHEISDELIQPLLKTNVSLIINRFVSSRSFDSAEINSELLIEISEYLSPTEWEYILQAFFENGQIYGSYRCNGRFETLFKKSIELSELVQPYWLVFRDNLNMFDSTHSNSLKRLIDSSVEIYN